MSLALLSYHFGSKDQLLAAVVEAHHVVCRLGLEDLRAIVQAPDAPPGLESLVQSWTAYEFRLYGSRDHAHYLRLLVRLHEDPQVDNAMRMGLHCAEPLVREGLERLQPSLSPPALDAAWLLASAALYAAILNSEEIAEDSGEAPDVDVREITGRFLTGGLSAYLEDA